MAIRLNRINEESYNNSKLIELFNDDQTRRSFAEITNNSNGFKLSWRSDLINPTIDELGNNIYSIGIDQNFVIINFEENKVLLNLTLQFVFLTTKFISNNIFICCELEIIKLENKENFRIMETYALPDLFEDLIYDNGFVMVKCFDNDLIKIA